MGTARLLGDIVAVGDSETALHCRRVAELAVAIADRLGLGASARRRVEVAALLHDIGTMTVPRAIRENTGRLTLAEWEVMRQHTVVGARMLAAAEEELADVAPVVLHSHERWDGRGYPDGLAGEAIPLESRIVAAADAYCAMTTDRPYRAAMSAAYAVDELQAGAGSQFDARVVTALIWALVERVAPRTAAAAA
jgi:putative nucleotidyltransferase with HDIG domain